MEVFSSMPPVWGMSPQLLAIIIMSICYLIIFSEKVNRAVIALLGAGLMIVSGILTQPAALKGIDFNTLALLTGMMIIVGIAEKSGIFQFVAVWGAKRVKASPRGLLIVLPVVTAVFSAFLDNVTTVLLIAPVTFQITRTLKINPYPYLMLEIFASNAYRRSAEHTYRFFHRVVVYGLCLSSDAGGCGDHGRSADYV